MEQKGRPLSLLQCFFHSLPTRVQTSPVTQLGELSFLQILSRRMAVKSCCCFSNRIWNPGTPAHARGLLLTPRSGLLLIFKFCFSNFSPPVETFMETCVRWLVFVWALRTTWGTSLSLTYGVEVQKNSSLSFLNL